MSQFNAKLTVLPTRLEISDSKESVMIDWEDGHSSTYPWWYLRGYCPCAMCQGHGMAWDFVTTEGVRLGEVQEVGQYALNLVWGDGHRTGIYTFDALRTLCPCDACRSKAGATHPWERLPEGASSPRLDGEVSAHSPAI